MAVYAVTGQLGTGKSLYCVSVIRDALWSGLRVATNLNLNLDELVSGRKPVDVIRLPDQPQRHDLYALGEGTTLRADERKFGVLVIDEASAWLNSRDYRDESRPEVVFWLKHARKFRWHVYLITQNLDDLDKQVKEGMVSHHVVCRRMDYVTVPFVGWATRTLGIGEVTFPRVHLAIVKAGLAARSPFHKVWYWARGMYAAYDTEQKLFGNGELALEPVPGRTDKKRLSREPAEREYHAVMLCPNRYPWLRKPRGLREALSNAIWALAERRGPVGRIARAVAPPMGPERHRRWEFEMAARGEYPRPAKPAPPSFAEWAMAQPIKSAAEVCHLEVAPGDRKVAPTTDCPVCQAA